MIFSTPQWLASFVLDVLIKTVLITVVGMFSLIGPPRPLLAEVGPSAAIALALSFLHFGNLVLGYAVASFGPVALKLSPNLKFCLAVLVANLLFGVIMNTFQQLSDASLRSIFEISSVTVAAIATNLLPILAVYVCDRIFLWIKRS